MSLLCRFGIHRRFHLERCGIDGIDGVFRPARPGIWECHGCPALWRRRYVQGQRARWEKIR